MYISGNQSDAAYQYSLSTAWDISTASYDGVWETEIVADADPEADDASFPITQMHEPPYGSGRTTPRQLVWAYKVANGANFDLKVRTLTGAGGGGSIVALCPDAVVEVDAALKASGFKTMSLTR